MTLQQLLTTGAGTLVAAVICAMGAAVSLSVLPHSATEMLLHPDKSARHRYGRRRGRARTAVLIFAALTITGILAGLFSLLAALAIVP